MPNPFIERPEVREKNNHVMSQNRVRPAVLSDGRDGVMIRVDGRVHVLTQQQAERFANAILDVLDTETENQK